MSIAARTSKNKKWTIMADFYGRLWSAHCGRFWPTGRPTSSAKSIWPADPNFKVGHQPYKKYMMMLGKNVSRWPLDGTQQLSSEFQLLI
jgi:hypothetical protein